MSNGDKLKQLRMIANPHTPRSLAMRPGVAERLAVEAQAIDTEDANRAGTTGFVARGLVQATLPYLEPDKGLPYWARYNGDYSLVVKPGLKRDGETNQMASVGYPYGSMPRLILAWIGTEAVRTRSPELVLGNRVTEFMKELGLQGKASGGQNGSITRLRDMMVRLFAADIAVVYGDKAAIGNSKVGIADDIQLWWDKKNPEQSNLWKSTITLHRKFFDELVANPVPIDLRAMKALKASPMAIDLYCWLTYRFFSIKAPTTIPWEALQLQFGSGASTEWKFREILKRNLQKVLAVYPANVEPTKAGLLLRPSHTSVPRASKDDTGF